MLLPIQKVDNQTIQTGHGGSSQDPQETLGTSFFSRDKALLLELLDVHSCSLWSTGQAPKGQLSPGYPLKAQEHPGSPEGVAGGLPIRPLHLGSQHSVTHGGCLCQFCLPLGPLWTLGLTPLTQQGNPAPGPLPPSSPSPLSLASRLFLALCSALLILVTLKTQAGDPGYRKEAHSAYRWVSPGWREGLAQLHGRHGAREAWWGRDRSEGLEKG